MQRGGRAKSRVRACAAFAATLVGLGSTACGFTADFSGLQGGTRATDGGAESASDAHVTSFCASLAAPVKLCSDFDEGAPVDTGWGATDVYGGEAFRIDSVAFSPPGSFFGSVNPSGAPASARLLQTVPTSSTHVRVAFELLLVPGDGTIELAVIHEVTSDGTTYGLFYREVNGELQAQLRTLRGDGTTFDQSWPIGPPPSSWTRVEMDMNVDAAGSFVIQHDGNVVASQTNVPTSTPSRTAMFVELGVYTFAPATAQANFDNAIVDWP